MFSVTKNLFNQCNPRLINDLQVRKITYEKNNLFLQNKPNFLEEQINVSSFITTNYEQRTMNYEVKNKANSNPNKANSNPISKQSQGLICLCRLLVNRLCYLYGPAISLDSAKMAQYMNNYNLKKEGRKKFNFLYSKKLNNLALPGRPTGTPFALSSLGITVLTNS